MTPTPVPLLSVRGVHKDFGATPALRGVDLEVLPGEVLAVMGPSGSGKSTLLHCMAGVMTPDRGTVSYTRPLDRSADRSADRPAARHEPAVVLSELGEAARSALRLREFGFVFQYGQLLPELSAVDNVTVPLLLAGTGRRAALRSAAELLGRLGLSGQEDRLPGELSGGQAQRVAIARAMVGEPALLFADEPTGSLDSLASETVLELMLELVREAGTTVVMITHDPRTAAYADREVIVRDGMIGADQWVAA
ncbi:ABC transporter ATP-binding protein [Kocuria rosea]|uniref:ABC transporter ATP-binding protein n=1 Tax=Kocuria rosea TaxID=1275 RepID=UPI000D64F9C9|nr:ABC transporter ATP-binding protein [Kocuria rosea]PWF84815.1 ABC transporter ATP-binding protein [Kocuria rosea]QCY31582.1 ABC transporter ATP-binding protein [Kocuria rosea]TQN38974.1 putative ABC transport system ATP-binding protein [Kocuria rosea]